MELNHLPAAPLNNGYRVTAGNGEQDPNCLVDEVGLEPTMPGAADLQSAGVTNFPTHP